MRTRSVSDPDRPGHHEQPDHQRLRLHRRRDWGTRTADDAGGLPGNIFKKHAILREIDTCTAAKKIDSVYYMGAEETKTPKYVTLQ